MISAFLSELATRVRWVALVLVGVLVLMVGCSTDPGVTNDDAGVDQTSAATGASAPAGQSAGSMSGLTASGNIGIELGQHYDDIKAAHADFPAQSEGTTSGDLTVFQWRDCQWKFSREGDLEEIRITEGSNADGLDVGGLRTEAMELYGDRIADIDSDDGSVHQLYAADEDAGTAWRIISAGDGTIEALGICLCWPDESERADSSAGGSTTSSRSGSLAHNSDDVDSSSPGAAAGVSTSLPPEYSGSGVPTVEILRPVSASGQVQPGWTMGGRSVQSQCGQYGVDPGSAAVEPGVVYCGGGASAADNCWSTGSGTAACIQDPFARTLFSTNVTADISGQPANLEAVPLAVVLSNGEQCRLRSGGAWGSIQGRPEMIGIYACQGGGTIWKEKNGPRFNTASSGWTANYTTDFVQIDEVAITKIVFVGTA